MASTIKTTLMNKNLKGNHEVGYLSGWHEVRSITNGAKCAVDLDNYTICEVEYTAEGAVAKAIGADTARRDMYLLATPEATLDMFGERIADFYNGKDEMCTPIYLDEGLPFATSAFTGALVVGDYVKFDHETKKFVKVATPDGTEIAQVIEVETDNAYVINGKDLIEVRIVK